MSERKEIVKELDSLFDIKLTCNYCGDDRHWADIIADYVLAEKAKSYQQGVEDMFNTCDKVMREEYSAPFSGDEIHWNHVIEARRRLLKAIKLSEEME